MPSGMHLLLRSMLLAVNNLDHGAVGRLDYSDLPFQHHVAVLLQGRHLDHHVLRELEQSDTAVDLG